MKNLFKHLSEIKEAIKRRGGAVLMFDFDGTLSPFAPTPQAAFLPRETKRILKRLAVVWPTVIITGRPLADIKRKIGLNNVNYSGNHGLYWELGGRVYSKKVPRQLIEEVSRFKQEAAKLRKAYRGMIIEDKTVGIVVHYRLVAAALQRSFLAKALALSRPLWDGGRFDLMVSNKLIELRPNLNWTKGDIALLVARQLQKKYKRVLLPIYVGDDISDEDAFRKVSEAITVRVGRRKNSAAKYYLKNQAEVLEFLKALG